MPFSISRPWRVFDRARLVRPYTLLDLRLRNAFSRKIRIGFGPVKSGEGDINVRKWRIDPIVHYINKTNSEYVADFFFDGDRLDRFDIVVIVKVYSDQLVSEVKRQRNAEKRFVVFDIVDNPLGCKRNIYQDNDFALALDGLILSSPDQGRLLDKHGLPSVLIEHPVINSSYKTSYVETDRELRLLWQGFAHNAEGMRRLEPLVREISATTGRQLKVVYHTNAPPSDDGFVQYIPWTIKNAFQTLTEVDIAVCVRDENRSWQEEKPSTKTIMYMAAGLPVVCKPASSDRLVIQHDVTGYFASSPNEWRDYLSRLVLDREVRERLGRAARQHVLKTFSVPQISEKYLRFFSELRTRTAR
jgi:hypothetical protein